MSYRVKKLTVGKGKTISREENGEWIKEYYEVELDIPDESELSIARENALALLNEWLNIAEKHEPEKPKFQWNPDNIKWVEAEGFRGKYERYPGVEQKAESTSDYKLLLEDLKKHNGRLTRGGFFYWLFEDNATVGRKPRKAKTPKEA